MRKYVITLLVGLLTVTSFAQTETTVYGSIINKAHHAGLPDTLQGVKVDFIVTTPVKDTLTVITNNSIGFGNCSVYGFGVPTGPGVTGYLYFSKPHYYFTDSSTGLMLGRIGPIACTSGVYDVRKTVIAHKRLSEMGTQIWMRDSSDAPNGGPLVFKDSVQVSNVIVKRFHGDSLVTFDTTGAWGTTWQKSYEFDLITSVVPQKNGYTFVQKRTWYDSLHGTFLGSDGMGYYQFEAFIQKPVKNTPATNGSNISKNTVFSWNSVPYATKYTLQVSTSKAFTNNLVSKDTMTTSYTATTAANTKYYWRVRTKIDANFSDWATDSFTTTSTSTGTAHYTTPTQTGALVRAGVLVYTLANDVNVQVSVYDLQGRVLMTKNQAQASGTYTMGIGYNGRYVVKFSAGDYQKTLVGRGF